MSNRTAVLVLCAVLAATGCMSFNGRELPRREVPNDLTEPPVVSLEVGEIRLLHNGEGSAIGPMMSASSIGELEVSQVLRMWQSRRLVKTWGKPGDLREEARYKLALTGTQNEEGSLFAAFVTGLTLYLFPSSATLRYDWRFKLTDLKSGSTYDVPVQRSLTVWQHLLFLPLLPLMPVGTYRGQRDQALYVWSELAKQGAWSSAAAPPRAPDR